MKDNIKPRLSKEEKQKIKNELKTKAAQERMNKAERRNEEKLTPIKAGARSTRSIKQTGNNKEKTSFFARKSKKEKEKINWKLGFKEFPVKMAREISRIRWVPKGSLGKRFLVVIIFIIIFALFYAALDQILIHLFNVAYVI